jgi:hypothetical protein
MVQLTQDPGFVQVQRHNDFTLNVSVWDPTAVQKTIPFRAQVDTGAWPLFISLEKVEAHGFDMKHTINLEASFRTINHKPITVRGSVRAPWYPEKGGKCLWDTFYVVEGLAHDILIGRKRWEDVKTRLKPSVLAMVPEIELRGGAFDLIKDRCTGRLDLCSAGEWIWFAEHRAYYRLCTDSTGE